MKRIIILLMITIGINAGEIKVSYINTENPAGGMNTWIEKYKVIENGKECIYEYSVGLYKGYIKNNCNGKEEWFDSRGKEYILNKNIIDPFFYTKAYDILNKGKKYSKDKTVISLIKNKTRVYCLKDKNICEKEDKILNIINGRKK